LQKERQYLLEVEGSLILTIIMCAECLPPNRQMQSIYGRYWEDKQSQCVNPEIAAPLSTAAYGKIEALLAKEPVTDTGEVDDKMVRENWLLDNYFLRRTLAATKSSLCSAQTARTSRTPSSTRTAPSPISAISSAATA
jgi:hypothetical protein